MKMHRLVVLGALALGCWAFARHAPIGSSVAAENGRGSNVVTTITLKDQLEKGLRARRPVEFRFLGEILALVDDGTLPRDLVQSSFNWARKKPSKKVQFFEQSLRFRAKRLGIDLQTEDTSL